jgi:DNA-binding transcriptional regulator YiaG
MNETPHTQPASEVATTEQCPNCESLNVRAENREDRFLYGVGEQATELNAVVPMHICADCGLEYTDEVGERLRQEAICRHLGILSPSEIVAIRESYNLSRRQFAAVTRIGLASLSRWEAGGGTQNPAMDIYIRLLSRKDVFGIIQRSDFEVFKHTATSYQAKFQAIAKLNPPHRARLEDRAKDFRIDEARATA